MFLRRNAGDSLSRVAAHLATLAVQADQTKDAATTRVQYSVFICDLSDTGKFAMRSDLESRMNESEDSVMIIDLGAAGDLSRFLFLGHREKLPSSSAVIL